MARISWLLPAILLFSPSPCGADVRLITPSGIQHFQQVQPAIDAAPDGALILLTGGGYSDFHIGGKSLSVVAFPNQALVNGTISIGTMQAHQKVMLSGLSVTAAPLLHHQ